MYISDVFTYVTRVAFEMDFFYFGCVTAFLSKSPGILCYIHIHYVLHLFASHVYSFIYTYTKQAKLFKKNELLWVCHTKWLSIHKKKIVPAIVCAQKASIFQTVSFLEWEVCPRKCFPFSVCTYLNFINVIQDCFIRAREREKSKLCLWMSSDSKTCIALYYLFNRFYWWNLLTILIKTMNNVNHLIQVHFFTDYLSLWLKDSQEKFSNRSLFIFNWFQSHKILSKGRKQKKPLVIERNGSEKKEMFSKWKLFLQLLFSFTVVYLAKRA